MVNKTQYWFGYLAQLVSFMALLVFNTLLPRAIGLEKFAMISLGYSVVCFGILLLDEGFNVEVILSKKRDWHAIIRVKMISCMVMCCLISVALPWILRHLNVKPVYMLPLQVFALNMIFLPFISAVSSYFIAVNKNETVVGMNIVSGMLIIAVPLLLSAVTQNELVIINSITVSYGIMAVLCAGLFFKSLMRKPLKRVYPASLILKSIDQSASSFTNVFFTWGIFLLVTKYYGNDIAVYNKIAYSICNAACAMLPLSSMNLYKLSSFDDEASGLYYKKLFITISALAVLASVALYFLGARLIGLLLGDRLAESAQYIQFLSFLVIFKAMTDVLRPLVLRKCGHAYLLVCSIAAIVASIGLIWLNSQYRLASINHLYYVAYFVLLLLFALPILTQKMRAFYGTT